MQLLNWASRFNSCSFLDNHQYASPFNRQECLVAAGCYKYLKRPAGKALQQLQLFMEAHPGQWFFGHLAYDLKNETEGMQSLHRDRIGFADLHFFIPQIVVRLHTSEIIIDSFNDDHSEILDDIIAAAQQDFLGGAVPVIRAGFTKEEYINTIHKLRAHILRGDCYEINFCQEFYASGAMIDPPGIYKKLSKISPNPFSAFYKQENLYLLCASPERYLMKRAATILSQPIKGTASRELRNEAGDELKKLALRNSSKEKSENVMVVDLVRNDLSKICEAASVQVDELFGIYTYPQVHQMISTISGRLRADITFSEIIQATFPMGSMTGAPKKRVMELVEQYEKTRRGLFSGAVGYIAPNGDFDFNVVIRSILYNADSQALSYHVGSGITFYSEGEKEHDECMLKAAAIQKALG
ncbi:MAG: anthranilate synthase component I family protein [Chitinophagaceae bacterium]